MPKQTLALYELAERHRSLLALQETEELPPEVIRDTIEALQGDFQDKAVAVGKVILNLQEAADRIMKTAKLREMRGKRMVERAEGLKAYLMLHLQQVGVKKVHHEDFDLRIQANAPSVGVDDATQIPIEYMRMSKIEAMMRNTHAVQALLDRIFDVSADGELTLLVPEMQQILLAWAAEAFTPHEPDKEAIREAHKQGIDVPGTHPVQGEHLRIVL